MMEVQKAKRNLQETQQKLIYSERVAAITKTTVSLHHEIKNPLAVISGNLQLCKKNPKSFYSKEMDIARMVNSVIRIQKVLQKLSYLTHPVETTYVGKTRMIDVRNVLKR